MRIQTDEQNPWNRKGIVVSQNNRPRLSNILNERGSILARSRLPLIPTSEKFNIKHDYDNVIPASNTSIHPSIMIDNQHEKPTREDVYRTRSGRVFKKPKRYITQNLNLRFTILHHMKGKFGITKMWTLLLQKKAITDFSWERAFERASADEKVSLFNKTIKNILSNYIPHEIITIDDRDPPWFNKNVKSLIDEKNKAWRLYVRSNKNDFFFFFFEKFSSFQT